jgi:hypothetical protein
MPNYQNGKIYKLWSPQGEEIYIGSTTQSLVVRKAEHKRLDCCSKILFEKYDDVRIELIEEYPCKNKSQLNRQEGHHIRNNECVNKNIAGRTTTEYYEDNKEHILEKQKEYQFKHKDEKSEYDKTYREDNIEKIKEFRKNYYIKNKEEIDEKNKIWSENNIEKIKEYKKKWRDANKEKHSQIITCDCCCEFKRINLARHKLSKKHIKFIQQQQEEQESLVQEE